jgi:hypothetical protein
MRGNLTTAPAFGATHIPQYPLELLATITLTACIGWSRTPTVAATTGTANPPVTAWRTALIETVPMRPAAIPWSKQSRHRRNYCATPKASAPADQGSGGTAMDKRHTVTIDSRFAGDNRTIPRRRHIIQRLEGGQ